MTRIRVVTDGGHRVTIDVGRDASVTIAAGPSGTSVQIDEARFEVITRYASGREEPKRSRVPVAVAGVSAAMEAAAVQSFLAGADVVRLGRSLVGVYEAMEAVRLGRYSDD